MINIQRGAFQNKYLGEHIMSAIKVYRPIDFSRLTTSLFNGKPDSVPIIELGIDPGKKAELLGRFITEPKDDIEFMRMMGYDFVTVGNHEFDFGPDFFAAMILAAHNLSFSGAVPFVASNMYVPDDLLPTDSGFLLKQLMGGSDGYAGESG